MIGKKGPPPSMDREIEDMSVRLEQGLLSHGLTVTAAR